MYIRINKPSALNEQGGGSNQEDSIYPRKGEASVNDRFFLVCDGIGGLQNGEVASATVCESFAEVLCDSDTITYEDFNSALAYAFACLDAADTAAEGERRMGTTLTFVCLHSGGAFMAHIGDSRIYHLRRQGKTAEILYKSRDHSLVNDLLRAEIITAEEAVNHPQKNIVTRAMQPHQDKPAKAEIHETADVRAGDYFFLCTDGVIECVSDALLCEIIAREGDADSKISAIRKACDGISHDNFSAYLIPIAEVSEQQQINDGAEQFVLTDTN
jgi:protein phosphatase